MMGSAGESIIYASTLIPGKTGGVFVETLPHIDVRGCVRMYFAAILVFPVVLLALTGCNKSAESASEAKISFTHLPQWDLGDLNRADIIEGKVDGARQGQQIVLYSKTGGLWWLQPRLNSPITSISSNGSWRNEVHVGTDYAALLVDSTFRPSAVLADLPKPGSGIDTITASRGQDRSGSSFVDFSGFEWRVRTDPSDRGGTENLYGSENVYVDRAGALHLQAVRRGEQWSCSEVSLTRSLGYGTYSFTLEDISHFEPAAVFSIFTWDYSSNRGNNGEFDINMSRWADPQNKNAEFVVQPYFAPLNRIKFSAPSGKLKHTIVWEAGQITMITSRALADGTSSVASKHVFASEVPTQGSESVHMAFYVYTERDHKLTSFHDHAEVVVDRFEYMP